MRFRPSAARVVLALGALLPPAAAAQSPADAFVLPFGMFRLGVEAQHATYDSRFDAAGSRVTLTRGLDGDLTPERFAAIQPLASSLEAFFAGTQEVPGASPSPGDPYAISAGTLDVAAAGSRTYAAAHLSVGLLPRLEIGASLPMGRAEHLVQRLDLSGGDLGLNPDPDGNAALLGTIGWEELGEAGLLPVAESPLGIELQHRVTQLTGESMQLPTDTLGIGGLQAILPVAYGMPPIRSRVEPWRVGDLRIHARGLLLSTFGDAPAPPVPDGIDLRVSLSAAARLATGQEPDTLSLLTVQPSERLSSLSAGAGADLFLGTAFWLTGTLELTRGGSTEITRRVAPLDAPLSVVDPPTRVTITPGQTVNLGLTPRFRLTSSIALEASYALHNVGSTRFSTSTPDVDASLLDLEGGTLQRLGVGIRYSSLPSFWVGEASLPADVVLRYERTLAGPEGVTGGGLLRVTASILPRLW